MATPFCEDEGALQEWAPETRLLNQIPLKAQRGIFSQNLKLTSVDVISDYIALGTNCGLVYWYCRKTARLDRLRIENTNCYVTCVKIVSTVDYMVAAGTDIGNVTVFQIPKAAPESVPDTLCPKQKQVERFTIDGLHQAPISCLEWSQNGMKLFSGDKGGAVVFTSIDFHMHLSKSVELLNEKFEVVQLSYHQQSLLVSTVYRTVVCDGNANWRVSQLGTKERKILGKFGATFCKFEHGVVIYASRPGLRLWLADRSGIIEQTLIFQSAVNSAHPKIPLINPVKRSEATDTNFGKLLQFGENHLVSYQSEMMYVIHPGAITVIASLNGARKILDVAVNNDEIFILEGDRSLLRIGHAPDLYAMEMPEEGAEKRKSFILDNFASKLKDSAVGSLKRITSELLPHNSTEEISPPALADEALDLPPIVGLPKGLIPPLIPENDVEVHESIDGAHAVNQNKVNLPSTGSPLQSRNNELEEVTIFRPGKRRKPKKLKNLQLQGPESESDTMSTTSDDRLVSGVANDPSASEVSPTSWSQSQSSFSVLRDINTLLNAQPSLPKSPAKTPDDKSQASIDTCESASEHMALAPEVFHEEQERLFVRLANQEISMLDSYNSERIDMSISVNLTPSSSASSKLSDNFQSSEISENVSMISENGTSCESQSDYHPSNDGDCPHQVVQETECLHPSAETSSVSSENSQNIPTNEDLQNNEPGCSKIDTGPKWNKEMILSQILGLELDDPLNKRQNQTIEEECANQGHSYDNDPYENDCKTPLVDSSGGTFVEEDRSLLPESDQELDSSTGNKTEDSSVVDPKLASLNGLSYGPPSGSSLMSSCHPSLEINTGPAVLSNPQALVVDKLDRWLQYKTPDGLSTLSVCNNYVVCTDSSDQTYYSELSGIALTWARLDYKATAVAMTLDASLVWILGGRGAVALVNPSTKGPFSEESMGVASNVRTIAVDKNIGYYVQPDGTIKCQKNLSRVPCGPSETVPCTWLVTSIACLNGNIVAITSDEEVICRSSTGAEFQLVPTPSKTITSIALGPANFLWVVDEHNNIYFSDDYLMNEPHWWQVLISEYIFRNSVSTFLNMHNRVKMGNIRANIQIKQTCVAANDSSVWVFSKYSSCVNVNKMNFTGYHWQDIFLRSSMKWVTISSEGVFEEKGHIWLLSVQGDLFSARPTSPSNIQSIPTPSDSDIACIACAPDTLWVLCVDGMVHARLGLTDSNISGTAWRELRLPQMADMRLVWISCGCDVAWGVNYVGRVFVTLGPPHDMATNIFDAAWLDVEGEPKDGTNFVKVFVGPHIHMVWALDNKRQIYVREGIFPHFQIGTGWVYVGGIEAVHLSISSTAVWALSPTGAIYRRHGITENNYIGDYWRRVPGTLSSLSASFCDGIWGFTPHGSIQRLLQRNVFIENGSGSANISLGDYTDWEVVQ